MELSAYYSLRPPMDLDSATVAAFDQLYTEHVEHGAGAEIPYTLDAPKWQFLSYLGDTKEVLFHGSGASDIAEFETRQSNDIHEFGNRQAVYAADDPLWAMYFAIVDRPRYVTSLVNASVRVVNADGSRSGPYYFFSVNGDALPHVPWRQGTIYILPRATFEHQANMQSGDMEIETAQWASLVPVRPLAKLTIAPEDFPFLAQIRGHDMAVIQERAARNPEGFPWLDEEAAPASNTE
jgi:hypothetical protein